MSQVRSLGTAVCECFLLLAFSATSATALQSQAEGTVPTLQLNVNRILVPVVVRDRQGHFAEDLKQEDFQVFDDDKPHAISGISVERRGPAETASPPSVPGDQSALPLADANRKPPQAQRFIVLMFDDMHLTPENMAQAKTAAAKVFTEALVGRDIGAVISLSQKVNSGLTRDRARLHDAIMSLQSRSLYQTDSAQCPNIDYYQADLIENKRDSMAMQDAVRKVFNCDPSLDPKYQMNVAESEAQSTARRILALGNQDVQSTYASIAAFVRSMARLPGERIMILVSPGFLRVDQGSLDAESRLMDLAAQYNVTISALDARGLYTTEITASENSPALGGPSLQQNADYKRSAMTQSEDPLAEIADATGGTFFHNSNDLGEGFKNLTMAPEVVYVLELSTDGIKADGSYHRLKVKVTRDGMQIQARHGYFMPKPGKSKN
ncbi:MAG: VWA domain-containing protein [Terracidiphilus sp.]